MAAGLSLPKSSLEPFRERFTALVTEWLAPEQLTGMVLTDGELFPQEFSLEMAEALRSAGPWGQAFPEPCFDGVFHLRHQRLVGSKHLKMEVEVPNGPRLDAIAFNVDLARWLGDGYRISASDEDDADGAEPGDDAPARKH